MTAPEVLDLTLPHLRMTALAWGPPDGRLALCLHGFPDSAWGWRRLAPLLADRGFRVVAPFTRGYAPTELPADGDYGLGALMYDALAVHRHLGAPTDAVLLGHDWGSFTANGLAATADFPFAATISMAVPPISALRAFRHGIWRDVRMGPRQLRMSWYILFFQLPGVPERSLDRVIPRLWRDWSPSGSHPDDDDLDIANALAALPSAAHRRAAVGYYRALVQGHRPDPRYAALHARRFDAPRGPILYLHGARDGAMQVGYAEHLLADLPDGSAVRVLPDAGHFLTLDAPDAVCAAVLEHLQTTTT
ncbi:alpha/beta fold hydrolase [Mycolicibacterium fallax]|uniref:Alpha/beta hydrolase n=1 Tax=Mycolicibacterium fallax TaxID=1793 RepID=A0A1X1R994_MYCFA|nr:alpha/beta fold hydrolase [Mycolicibacterium fallax]ORV01690.1 alpha/beta hydrolase [Mycolicibacterium fallax]BBY98181.1 alpha/beta hydrolase [Mycolicibacterium fallax]